MFDTILDEEVASVGAPVGEDWFDPAWLDQAPPPEDVGQVPMAQCAPSGWLALELDHGTVDPERLSDAELIDTVVDFERVAAWAGARQAALLAEFARRRPDDGSQPTRSDVPSRCSEFASDEIGLALRLSRTTAANRLVMVQVLVADLPGTLAAWEAGQLDVLKVRAITEASYLLTSEQATALEARVLPRAGQQTVSQLRAAIARAVLAIDPDGAEARYRERRKDRRVVVSPDGEGMASLWALLSAPDATAAYQRLCQLARGLGVDDPRAMDARRADLLVELLTGRRCAATGDCPDDCDGHCHEPPGGDACADDEATDGVTDATRAGQDPAPSTSVELCRRATRGGAWPGKPLVSVIVPITMLLGLDEQPAELVGYGPIPASMAREIAAEGTWRRLLTDPVSGTLLDYGRTTYVPPVGLADFVRARDVYCRFPTCQQRAATADLDHVIPYEVRSGPTSEHNLFASCRHHHRLKTHSPGWNVEQHTDGRITFTTATGHSYTSWPHDYRADPEPALDPSPDLSGSRIGAGHKPPKPDLPPF
ncbi:MAG: DUF222 domain-containing protein [Pseudonocardiaceae bacterium]